MAKKQEQKKKESKNVLCMEKRVGENARHSNLASLFCQKRKEMMKWQIFYVLEEMLLSKHAVFFS